MGRPARSNSVELGSDSFLDVMANMVGILIILVVMVGVRMKHVPKDLQPLPEKPAAGAPVAVVEPAADPEPELEVPEVELASSSEMLRLMTDDMKRMAQEHIRLAQARAYQQREAAVLSDEVARRQARIDERRRQLGAEEQASVALAQQIAQLEMALRQVNGDLASANEKTQDAKKIENYPTPLAQAVTGEQVFFQVLDGRVVAIPMQALLEKAVQDLKRQVTKLHSQNEISCLVGPIGNFRLKYVITRENPPVGEQLVMHRGADIREHSVLIPLSQNMGETLSEALAPGSQFRTILRSLNPQRTTVTFWVYPDSFEVFRGLKKELHQQGFATAGRPLPMGHPIGSSSQGSASQAQ